MDEAIQRFPGGLTAPQEWLDLLVPKLPNTPVDMIKHELLTITRDFCKRSGAWQDWLRPLLVDGAALEYGLVTGNPDTEVVSVLRVLRTADQYPLTPIPPEWGGPPEFIRRGGEPMRYWQTQPDRLFLDPLPLLPTSITPFVTLAPLEMCGLPDWFRSEHQYAIVDGVLGHLCAIAGPNYRPKDALRHRQEYLAARGRARTRAMAGYNRAATMTQFPYFARGSQR